MKMNVNPFRSTTHQHSFPEGNAVDAEGQSRHDRRQDGNDPQWSQADGLVDDTAEDSPEGERRGFRDVGQL